MQLTAVWESGCMTNNRDLTEKIEQLVREHIEETRVAVVGAVSRAFATSATGALSRAPSKTSKPRKESRRRGPEEVTALAERLYERVCAKPGEGMVVFAADLGASARELHRPMTNLKRAGRVRSVGERHRARYFPAVGGEAAGSSSQSA